MKRNPFLEIFDDSRRPAMASSPDMIDASCRTPPPERPGIAEEKVVVVAPEEVHRHSGHRFAVWAVAILEVAEFPVRLVIRDTGRAARDVADFAGATGFGERVILTGPDRPAAELMEMADVAMFLGRDRLCAVQLAAAMSAGVPIVAGDVAAASGCLADGQNALLVRADKPRDIARALMRLIEDPQLRRRLGAAGRAAVKESRTRRTLD